MEVVAANEKARKDFKTLRQSSNELFKAGHMQNLKAEVRYHSVGIITIEEFHNNKLYVYRPYSFFSRHLHSKEISQSDTRLRFCSIFVIFVSMLSVRLRVDMYFHAPFAFVLYLCRYWKFYENKKKQDCVMVM